MEVSDQNIVALILLAFRSKFLANITILRSSRPEVFCKKDALKYFTKFIGKVLCRSLLFPKSCRPVRKEIPAYVFSYKIC